MVTNARALSLNVLSQYDFRTLSPTMAVIVVSSIIYLSFYSVNSILSTDTASLPTYSLIFRQF